MRDEIGNSGKKVILAALNLGETVIAIHVFLPPQAKAILMVLNELPVITYTGKGNEIRPERAIAGNATDTLAKDN